MQLQLRWRHKPPSGSRITTNMAQLSRFRLLALSQFVPYVTLSGLMIRSPGITPDPFVALARRRGVP